MFTALSKVDSSSLAVFHCTLLFLSCAIQDQHSRFKSVKSTNVGTITPGQSRDGQVDQTQASIVWPHPAQGDHHVPVR